MTGEGDVCGGAGGVGGDDGEVWGCGVEGGEVVGERADVVGGVMRVGEHGDGGCAVCGGLGGGVGEGVEGVGDRCDGVVVAGEGEVGCGWCVVGVDRPGVVGEVGG